jgi:tetraacyldisaccharide 4'-kinase
MRYPPSFWYPPQEGSTPWQARLLSPAGRLVYAMRDFRFLGQAPYESVMPILCVGNLVVGGSGKTPTCIFLAKQLMAAGWRVHFLSRGYGGKLSGPIEVDPVQHGLEEVGDEALLLDTYAPTWISRDRVEGARAAAQSGAHVVIMDDGFQNHASLHQDLCLVVIDGQNPFGNGRLMPAGPLREPIEQGLERAHAIVVVGDTQDIPVPSVVVDSGRPILRAEKRPIDHGGFPHGTPVIAFAGIGKPEQFFTSLEKKGFVLVQKHAFPDHYLYDHRILERLVKDAENHGAVLMTTEKDMIRIPQVYHGTIIPFVVELWMGDEDQEILGGLIQTYLSANMQRSAVGEGTWPRQVKDVSL